MDTSVEQHKGSEDPARHGFSYRNGLGTNKAPAIMQVVQLNTRNGRQLDSKGKESMSWSLRTAPDRFRAILEKKMGLGQGELDTETKSPASVPQVPGRKKGPTTVGLANVIRHTRKGRMEGQSQRERQWSSGLITWSGGRLETHKPAC